MVKFPYGFLLGKFFIAIVKLLIGATPIYIGSIPSSKQRIYFANHSSHMDTIALWAALPYSIRKNTRPVAAKDYWSKGFIKRYIVHKTLKAVLIDRDRKNRDDYPLQPVLDALQQGDSIIIFPEGTRKAQALPGAFKSGIYRLVQQFPNVELIPVYLENLHRSMPKGSFIPVPIVCTVRFGAPLTKIEGENKQVFLERARQAVVGLACM